MRGLKSIPEPTYASEGSRTGFWSMLKKYWRPQNKPLSRPQEEQRYHHTPTHAASDFVKTATTPAMIAPMDEQARARRGQRGEIQRPPVSGERNPNESLI
jgi:hypothetical protein